MHTHIIQPMDVAVFRPLKIEWKKEVHKYKIENYAIKFKKDDFAPLLDRAIKNSDIASYLVSGFKVCGFFPYNSNAISYYKLLAKKNPMTPLDIPIIPIRRRNFDESNF